MNFEEHAAKPLLRAVGIATPQGALAATPAEAGQIVDKLGPCVLKAQVPAGKRGKAGGIKLAADATEAQAAAAAILGMSIAGHLVEKVLVETQVAIAHELYAAVLNDPASKGPLLLFSGHGGMDIEEIAAAHPGELVRLPIDICKGLDVLQLKAVLPPDLPCDREKLADVLLRLYTVYAGHDAELVEINPLVVTKAGDLVALDCKLAIDDSALPRREALAQAGTREQLTELETRASLLDLKFIELDGSVGVLANGAGLTMTTMDAVRHFGGDPANFMEIGGESYTKATPALELVLSNPRVKCLLVNFCGAFARTDVMVEGVIKAWLELTPKIPIFFTIHGTGEDEAIAMVKERLGITPFDLMDDAVKAAIAAAEGTPHMIVRGSETVLVQGITGKQGTFWSERMRDYGTKIIGGVNPKRAGEAHLGLPVWATAGEAARQTNIDATVMFIPPFGVKAAALDAIEAGIGKIVCLTEHVPVHDTMYILAAARERGTQVLGPNTAGIVTAGACFLGFMPAFNPRVFRPGHVGVISRSGSLGTLICLNLVQAGLGISAFIGIGGDPIIGTTTRDALVALDHDPNTTAIALIGEIGGAMEEEAAEYARTMKKPVAAFIAGAASPPGKRMGHAGAIVMGDKGSYAGKKAALEAAGVTVCATPNGVAEVLKGNRT